MAMLWCRPRAVLGGRLEIMAMLCRRPRAFYRHGRFRPGRISLNNGDPPVPAADEDLIH